MVKPWVTHVATPKLFTGTGLSHSGMELLFSLTNVTVPVAAVPSAVFTCADNVKFWARAAEFAGDEVSWVDVRRSGVAVGVAVGGTGVQVGVADGVAVGGTSVQVGVADGVAGFVASGAGGAIGVYVLVVMTVAAGTTRVGVVGELHPDIKIVSTTIKLCSIIRFSSTMAPSSVSIPKTCISRSID
jgi:hypothetical protein